MNNTIEEIENDFLGKPEYNSHLVTTCHKLRKKNLSDFEIEDLRIMVGQNIALPILVPLAINRLRENLFAEGDFYPGDLLKNVLRSSKEFWDENIDLKNEVISLFEKDRDKLNEVIYADEIISDVLEAYEVFKK